MVEALSGHLAPKLAADQWPDAASPLTARRREAISPVAGAPRHNDAVPYLSLPHLGASNPLTGLLSHGVLDN